MKLILDLGLACLIVGFAAVFISGVGVVGLKLSTKVNDFYNRRNPRIDYHELWPGVVAFLGYCGSVGLAALILVCWVGGIMWPI